MTDSPTTLSLIVAAGPWDPEPWRARFRVAAGGRRVRFWPQDGDGAPEGPYVICAWKADPRVFDLYPSPRAVFSLGAGVDHLAVLRERAGLPVFRVVDADLTMRMVEYVAFAVLYLHRQIARYEAARRERAWRPLVQAAASAARVGIMGVGVMGAAAGRALQGIGFDVAGWARTPKPEAPFPVAVGAAALDGFLAGSDILVNVLPNTPATASLIDGKVFAALGRDRAGAPSFVNAGRGETVVEADLVAALRTGRLAGAVLDVFAAEPLPPDNPLWAMDNVLVTPHVAADSDPDAVVPQLMADVARLERGEMPARAVDMRRGY